MFDLAEFCNDDSLPAVAQAAIAHPQFETIHPFVDGNGRTGRALIHLVLRRRGLAPRILSPVSLTLATWPRDYVGGLTRTPSEGAPDSEGPTPASTAGSRSSGAHDDARPKTPGVSRSSSVHFRTRRASGPSLCAAGRRLICW